MPVWTRYLRQVPLVGLGDYFEFRSLTVDRAEWAKHAAERERVRIAEEENRRKELNERLDREWGSRRLYNTVAVNALTKDLKVKRVWVNPWTRARCRIEFVDTIAGRCMFVVGPEVCDPLGPVRA